MTVMDVSVFIIRTVFCTYRTKTTALRNEKKQTQPCLGVILLACDKLICLWIVELKCWTLKVAG